MIAGRSARSLAVTRRFDDDGFPTRGTARAVACLRPIRSAPMGSRRHAAAWSWHADCPMRPVHDVPVRPEDLA